MSVLKYIRNPQLSLSILRQFKANLRYQVNTGEFWDTYVLEWEADPKNQTMNFLGDEWDQEHTFLHLLESYASLDSKALEIGCGGGRITSFAVSKFAELHSGDVSDLMLEKCAEAVDAANLTLHKLDGFTLNQFHGQEFDLVFSHDVFVHFPEPSIYTYLREIDLVLKTGGRGIISFFSLERSFGAFKDLTLQTWSKRQHPSHMRVYFVLPKTIKLMLEDIGFKVVETRCEDFLIFVFEKQ